MDDMEAKLGQILGNPEMMAQIMQMAQSLGTSPNSPPPPEPPSREPPTGPDPAMISKLAQMANSASVDSDQRNLLLALQPYLTDNRIGKLEKAMRAAKLAGVVSTILGNGILTQADR